MSLAAALPPAADRGDGLPQPKRALAIAAVLGAMSLVVLDAGMANVALPTMARALGASPAQVVQVITAYQTALVMALLPCAAVGERFGNRLVFQAGVALFVVSSLLCAVSPTLPWLVAARFAQGLGGAAVMALGVALLRFSVRGDQLGAAIGWNAMTVALSSAAAPSLGAMIITHLDWTWLFLTNLPTGIAALLASWALPAIEGRPGRLDTVSIGLNGAVFGLLVVAAQAMPREPAMGGVFLAAAVVAIAALVRREAPKATPVLPLDLLRRPSFRLSVIASTCCSAATSATLLALPFHLEQALHLSALNIGLSMSAWPLSVAVAATLAGRFSSRFSTAALCGMGGLGLSVGLALLALWRPDEAAYPPIVLMAVCGAGFGLFQVPNNRNLFLSAPPERSGAAGGVQGTARLTGQTAGAIMISLLFTVAPHSSVPAIGFGAAAVLALASSVLSFSRIHKERGSRR